MPVSDLMTYGGVSKWTHVGSFPAEPSAPSYMRNSAIVNGLDIYFDSSLGIVYKFDTVNGTVTQALVKALVLNIKN